SEGIGEIDVPNIIRHKASSFEKYWLASKGWERKGLPLGTGRALANAGFLTVDDLHTAHDFELASIPGVGAKSLAKTLRADRPENAGRAKDEKKAAADETEATNPS